MPDRDDLLQAQLEAKQALLDHQSRESGRRIRAIGAMNLREQYPSTNASDLELHRIMTTGRRNRAGRAPAGVMWQGTALDSSSRPSTSPAVVPRVRSSTSPVAPWTSRHEEAEMTAPVVDAAAKERAWPNGGEPAAGAASATKADDRRRDSVTAPPASEPRPPPKTFAQASALGNGAAGPDAHEQRSGLTHASASAAAEGSAQRSASAAGEAAGARREARGCRDLRAGGRWSSDTPPAQAPRQFAILHGAAPAGAALMAATGTGDAAASYDAADALEGVRPEGSVASVLASASAALVEGTPPLSTQRFQQVFRPQGPEALPRPIHTPASPGAGGALPRWASASGVGSPSGSQHHHASAAPSPFAQKVLLSRSEMLPSPARRNSIGRHRGFGGKPHLPLHEEPLERGGRESVAVMLGASRFGARDLGEKAAIVTQRLESAAAFESRQRAREAEQRSAAAAGAQSQAGPVRSISARRGSLIAARSQHHEIRLTLREKQAAADEAAGAGAKPSAPLPEAERLGALLEALAQLAEAQTEAEIADVVKTALPAALGCATARVLVRDELARARLEVLGSGGDSSWAFVGSGIVGMAVDTGSTIVVDDASKDERYSLRDDGRVADLTPMIAVPLRARTDSSAPAASANADAADGAPAEGEAGAEHPAGAGEGGAGRAQATGAEGVLQLVGRSREEGGSPFAELTLICAGWAARTLQARLLDVRRSRLERLSARARFERVQRECTSVMRRAAAAITYPPRRMQLETVVASARPLGALSRLAVWHVHEGRRQTDGSDDDSEGEGEGEGEGTAEGEGEQIGSFRSRSLRAHLTAEWLDSRNQSLASAHRALYNVSSDADASNLEEEDEEVIRAVTSDDAYVAAAGVGSFTHAPPRSIDDLPDETHGPMLRALPSGQLARARRVGPGEPAGPLYTSLPVSTSEHVVLEIEPTRPNDAESAGVAAPPSRAMDEGAEPLGKLEQAAMELIGKCAVLVLRASGSSGEAVLRRRHAARMAWLRAYNFIRMRRIMHRMSMQEAKVKAMEEQALGMRQRANLLLESAAVLEATRDEEHGAEAHTHERSLSTIGRRIMSYAEKQLVIDRSSLWLYEPSRLELYSVYATGLDRTLIVSVRGGLAQRAGLAAAAIAQDKTIVVEDAYEHPWFNPAVDRSSGYVTRSVVVIPLRSTDGDVLGVIQLINKHPYVGNPNDIVPFSQEDVVVAQALSTQISLTIEIMRVKRQAENAIELVNRAEQAAPIKEDKKALRRRTQSSATPSTKPIAHA